MVVTLPKGWYGAIEVNQHELDAGLRAKYYLPRDERPPILIGVYFDSIDKAFFVIRYERDHHYDRIRASGRDYLMSRRLGPYADIADAAVVAEMLRAQGAEEEPV